MFQSLLHQGISLLLMDDNPAAIWVWKFQSLLHQGISLLDDEFFDQSIGFIDTVSIPSSSGHQFTGLRVFRSSFGIELFQSLLHQGISLLRVRPARALSRIRDVSIPSSSGHQFTAVSRLLIQAGVPVFQSLLHQGISLLGAKCAKSTWNIAAVSIPSSSGHQFTGFRRGASGWWDRGSFNPFFIRASVYCVAYGIYLIAGVNGVSIPSSSGHQFTAWMYPLGNSRPPCFNPFFIRASVY